MIRVVIVYEQEPEPGRYEQHAELCRRVEGGAFRHGQVFGAPFGDPKFAYYAEWEFPDLDAFKAASRTPEFAETGKDAMALDVPFHVFFVDVA